MNRFANPTHALIVVLLVAGLLAGCGGPATAALARQSTEAPTVESTPAPPSPATETSTPESSPTPAGQASEAPSADSSPIPDISLRPAELAGPIVPEQQNFIDIPVFVGNGSIPNEAGQVLLIKVRGITETSVRQYFGEARFGFAIQDSFPFPPDSEPEPQARPPQLSRRVLLSDLIVASLDVEFQVSAETAREHPKGVVYIVVDPSVNQSQYNNYGTKDPSTDSVSLKVKTSVGRVTARLYRQCVYRTGATVAAPNETEIANSGTGKFDLSVYGNNTGSSTYRLTGAWAYDYTTPATSSPTESITCT